MGNVGFGTAVGIAFVTCTVAAVVVGWRLRSRMKWKRVVRGLRELEEACGTSVSGSKLKMLLAFVDKLPNGN
ncbi:hypothetical protein Nepgr_011278 [Nepenthes gracilis]|uniref:Uncharacterized protein n=1 Tax=Nepenthes gracilis TaxID=150966 RepID=A0AAD3SF17_NEPGR|nr:hypothetical protein Nepgr_011278 [Nepenthes gracilis]